MNVSVRSAMPSTATKEVTALQALYVHVLETAPAVEQEQRARIYRALADIIGDESFALRLHERADAAEATLCADIQLVSDYKKALGRA